MAILPSVFLLMIRLSRRDVGVVLEASEWAINHRLRLPRWAGRVFTVEAPLPEGAVLSRSELLRRFSSAQRERWLLLVVLSTLLGLAGGYFFVV